MTDEELNEILTDLVGNWSRASDLQGKFDAINQAKSALVAMNTQELGHTILGYIAFAEKRDTSKFTNGIKLDLLEGLIKDIKQLCQKEVNKQ